MGVQQDVPVTILKSLKPRPDLPVQKSRDVLVSGVTSATTTRSSSTFRSSQLVPKTWWTSTLLYHPAKRRTPRSRLHQHHAGSGLVSLRSHNQQFSQLIMQPHERKRSESESVSRGLGAMSPVLRRDSSWISFVGFIRSLRTKTDHTVSPSVVCSTGPLSLTGQAAESILKAVGEA